jgi:hypothetical protein
LILVIAGSGVVLASKLSLSTPGAANRPVVAND